MKEQKQFALIKGWDFDSRENDGCLFSTPIPISYQGCMSVQEIEKFLEKRDQRAMPIFSGDGKAIYCFSPQLAKELIKKGHKLLIELKKEFKVCEC